MIKEIFATAALLTSIGLAIPIEAENPTSVKVTCGDHKQSRQYYLVQQNSFVRAIRGKAGDRFPFPGIAKGRGQKAFMQKGCSLDESWFQYESESQESHWRLL
jgi:hypothetical protein